MGKSLFLRMIFVYLLIIVVAFTLLGGLFFTTLRNNFLDSQMDKMIGNAGEVNEWSTDNYYGRLSDMEFREKLVEKAQDEGTVIWLVSKIASVYMIADPEGKGEIEEKFSSTSIMEFYNHTQQGNCAKQVSNVDRSFKGTVISVAVPLFVDEAIVGAIVVHREIGDLNVGMSSIFLQVLFPLLGSIAVAFMLVFILSRYIVRPIKDISRAAVELSRGNLDWRIKAIPKDEIGELAISFNKMAEEIKLQDSLKNTFIANVSHELRTPLTSVQGFIQGMLDRAIEEQDRDEYLEIVLGETKRMNLLISDLLSLAKIESGQFPIELSEFDINELLRRCILMFEKRIEDKKLMVDISLGEDKMMVWADEDRISQVITNIVDNAVKFSKEKGELKLWTHIADNKVYINIADTGEGIPEKERPYIFERFYKVDKSHSRKTAGTGIGLSLVKRIISQHGEKISVQSIEGKGTTFTFTLTRAAWTPEKPK